MNEVVTIHYHENTIAEISLEDRAYKNTFSRQLIEELMKIFSSLQASTKVVFIHGYENYFCCGGTQEELLNIYHGKITFADLAFYRLLLDCEVPTIAAMQGHAVGGSLVFGCYADMIIAAEEAIYSANFMRYGFMPGMGATYILPKKLGTTLANEMLFSARNFQGGELKIRNAPICIVKKQQVFTQALEMAKNLAEKPLTSLKLLKQHLTQTIKKELPSIVEQELAMHAVSFKQPKVEERIRALFST